MIFFISPPAYAAEAHVHGAATLSVAFDGAKGSIEFKTPSDAIIGFEHEAKSPADKKKQTAALKKFEDALPAMVALDPGLHCKYKKEKLESVKEAETHSDTVASFSVVCDKSPAGTVLTFSFKKYFPAVKDVDAQILVDNLQKSAEIRSDGVRVELK